MLSMQSHFLPSSSLSDTPPSSDTPHSCDSPLPSDIPLSRDASPSSEASLFNGTPRSEYCLSSDNIPSGNSHTWKSFAVSRLSNGNVLGTHHLTATEDDSYDDLYLAIFPNDTVIILEKEKGIDARCLPILGYSAHCTYLTSKEAEASKDRGLRSSSGDLDTRPTSVQERDTEEKARRRRTEYR